MQKLGKRFLSLVMVGAMILSCNMVAFAKEDVPAVDNVAIEPIETSSQSDIVPYAQHDWPIVSVSGNINQLTYENHFKASGDIGRYTSWTPYIIINQYGADYCVYAAVYETNGTRVCGTTFNVTDGMNGTHKVADVKLSPFKEYVCKLIFDKKTNVGYVVLKTD